MILRFIRIFLGQLRICVYTSPMQQPGIGGEVVPHQDNSFLYTEPTTCTGLWLALEDANITNGCLWAIPGSHKSKIMFSLLLVRGCLMICSTFNYFIVCLDGLKRRFIRDEKGVHFDHPSPTYDLKEFVPLEVKAGSLVVIDGNLVHQRSVLFYLHLRLKWVDAISYLTYSFFQLWKSISKFKTCF